MKLLFILVCIVAGIFDGTSRRIPNFTVVAILLLKLAELILSFDPVTLFDALFAALFAGIVFFIPRFMKKEIGFGDVKFAIALAFYLGFVSFVYAMIFAMVSALIYLAFLFIAKKKDIKNIKVPLGIFMSVGSVIVVLFDLIR